jgi:alpha-D-ribose 1-methylphosphonate 5-phosphate C-P lyase
MRVIIGDELEATGGVYVGAVGEGRTNLLSLTAPQRRRLRTNIMSVVYQNPALGLDLNISAGGNIADALIAAGWRSYHQIRRRAAELLERVEVPLSRMDDVVGQFSGGMQQRVQIAKALATDPQVLLLDEPTSSVEPDSEAAIIAALDRLMAGRTTVLTSHRPSLISQADVVYVIEDGRVVDSGSPQTVRDRNRWFARFMQTPDQPAALPPAE